MDKELKKLICSDLHRLGIKKSPSVFGNGLPLQAKYLILWRKAAFYYKRGGFLRKWYGWRLDKMQERTQITLPREVQAGSGLYIGHLGRLIVHPDVKMGSNNKACVTITAKKDGAYWVTNDSTKTTEGTQTYKSGAGC